MPLILIVDDEPTITHFLAELLTDEGFAVETADSGAAALERIAVRRPDLVISDLMMPVMSGRQLCALLRADPATQELPVVLVSAGGEWLDEVPGVTARLTKPFDIGRLLDCVHALTRA